MRPVLVRRPGRSRFAARRMRERTVVRCPRTHLLVEPRHRLGVVVQNRDRRGDDGRERRMISLEIRDQDLDRALGDARFDGWRAVAAKCPAPPSGRSSRFTEVITTCRSPRRATASATRRGSSGSTGERSPVIDRTEPTRARAGVTEQHQRRRVMRPAFAEVRTLRFLADRVQAERPDGGPRLRHGRPVGARLLIQSG